MLQLLSFVRTSYSIFLSRWMTGMQEVEGEQFQEIKVR